MRYFLTPSGVNMVKDEVADKVKATYPQFREIDIYVGEDGKPSYIFKEASAGYKQQNPRARQYQYGMFSQDMAPDYEADATSRHTRYQEEQRQAEEQERASARRTQGTDAHIKNLQRYRKRYLGSPSVQTTRREIAEEEIDKAPFLALDEMLSRYPGENPNIRITEQRARVRQEHIREIAEPFSMGMSTKQHQYYRNAREWADEHNGLQRLGENVLMGAFDFFTSPAQAINPGSELADFSTYERQGVNSASGTIGQIVNSVAYSIPQTLGMVAFTMGSAGLGSLAGKAGLSAIASGAARAGSIATKAAGYGMTGAQILAPLNKDDYDKGRFNLSNVLVNVGSAAVQTAIEYVNLGSQMGNIQKAWQSGGKLAVSNLAQGYVKDALEVSLKQFGKPILMSGLQEGAEEIAQGITEKMFNLIKGDSLPNAEEWAKELALSFVGGMLGGLVFGTVGSGIQMSINNKIAQTLQYNATRYPNSVAHLNQAIIQAQNQQWEDATQSMLQFEKGNAYDKVSSPEIQKAYNLVSDALRMYDAGIILDQQKKRRALGKEKSKLFQELKALRDKSENGTLTDQEQERMLIVEDRHEAVWSEIEEMVQQKENVKSFRDIQRLAKEIAVTEAQIEAMEDGEEKLLLTEQNKQKIEQLQIMDANLKESIAALMQTMPKAEQSLIMGEKYPAHAVLGAQQASETGQPTGDQQQTQPGTLPGQTTPQEQPGNTPMVLTAEEREAQRQGIKIDQSRGMKAGDVNEMIDRSDPESLEEGVKPPTGKETKVLTSKEKKITVKWALVKLKDLVVSNDPISFSENKEYPGEIQNRKRDRAALKEQVENIAKKPDPERLMHNVLGQYGAPVIFKDKSGRWVVLGGNGRVMGLKRRMAQLGEGSLQEYEDYVKDHLAELGFDPDTDTTGMVLVRDYYGDEDVIEISRELNSSETAEISSMEQASGDAVTIANAIRKGNNIFDFLDFNQPLTPDKQEAFYSAFYELCVKDGNQYLTSGGNYNSKMQERVEMAMWMYLFNGDSKAEDLLSDYFETEESNIKSIITGIIDNMPVIISLRRMTEKYNLPDYDISQTVLEAISTISAMKRKKIALEKIIEETDIFSENQNVIQEDKINFYRALFTIKSMKAGRAFFGGYYTDALDALDPEQDSFLLDLADSSPEKYLNEYTETWIKNEKEKERQRAERAAARANQKSDPASLDTGGDAQKTDTETRQSRNLKNKGLPGREETIQSVKNALGFNDKTDKVSVSDDGRTVTFDTADGRHVILNLHKNVIQGSYGPAAGQMSRKVIDGKLTYIIDLVEAFNSGNRAGYHEAFHMAWFMSTTVEQRKFLEKHYTRLILNGKAYDENGRMIHMSQAKWDGLTAETRSVYIEEQAAMGAEAVWGARGDVLPTITNKVLQRIGDRIRRALVAIGWATENMKLEDIFVRAGTGKLGGTGVQMDGARNKPLIGLDAAMKIDKTAAMTSIQKAMDMEKAGKSREDIWEATGWERSAIGTFKTEIPAPLSSELRMDKVTYQQWDDRARAASGYIEDVAVGSTATFAFVDFRDIYPSKYIEDAYGADIANIDVLFVKNETGAEHGGFWSPSRRMIVISSRQDISPQLLNSDSFRRWTLEVLVHELQHAIQTNEGDSEGTPRSYDTQNPEYQVATHEVEARNAERRAMQRERGVTVNAPLSMTEDVDRSKQESLWRNIQINGNEVRIHGDKGEDQYQQYFKHEAADALKTKEMRILENKIVGLTTAPNTMLDTVLYCQNNLYNRIIDSNIIKDIRDKDTAQIDAKMNRVRRWMNAHMSEGLNQDQIPLVRKLMSLLRKQLHSAKVQDLGRDKDNMSTKQRAYARALVDEDAMLRLFQDSEAEVGLMESIADMFIEEIKRYNSPDRNSETGKYNVTTEAMSEAFKRTTNWLNDVMAEEREAWKKLGLDNRKNTLDDIEKADPDGSKRETAGWTNLDFDEAIDAFHLIWGELTLAVKRNTETVTRNKNIPTQKQANDVMGLMYARGRNLIEQKLPNRFSKDTLRNMLSKDMKDDEFLAFQLEGFLAKAPDMISKAELNKWMDRHEYKIKVQVLSGNNRDKVNDSKYDTYSSRFGEDYREYLFKSSAAEGYWAPHFSKMNIVMHMRLSDVKEGGDKITSTSNVTFNGKDYGWDDENNIVMLTGAINNKIKGGSITAGIAGGFTITKDMLLEFKRMITQKGTSMEDAVHSAMASAYVEASHFIGGESIPADYAKHIRTVADQLKEVTPSETKVLGHSQKPGLLIEEMQSDFHQAAREQGYRDPAKEAKTKAILKELDRKQRRLLSKNGYKDLSSFLNAEWDAIETTGKLERQMVELTRRGMLKSGLSDVNSEDLAELRKRAEANKQERTKIMELKTEIMNIENQRRAQRADLEALPNLPLKKFHEFLFKYALLESAQKGYSDIYWTTGDMQADRYGRDAERESGMKGFYDKIVGDYANKLAKRYGVKADVVTLKAPQHFRGNAEFNHMTITPEMRQDMLQQGLPRYKMAPDTAETTEAERQMEAVRKQYEGTDQWMKAPNGKPTKLNERQWLQVRTPNFKKWFGDWENDPKNASKVVDSNGEPMVVYHGTDADFTQFIPQDVKFGSFYGTGFYFSQLPTRYFGKKTMQVFLNIRNMAKFDDDMTSRIEEYDLYDVPFALENVDRETYRNLREYIEDNDGAAPLWQGAGHVLSPNQMTKHMLSKGYDGAEIDSDIPSIFIENSDDLWGKEYVVYGSPRISKTSSYVQFNKDGSRTETPNIIMVPGDTQIKSAVANVGTFDAENADIRYKQINENKLISLFASNVGDSETRKPAYRRNSALHGYYPNMMDVILPLYSQYEGTDKWMKAPNGKPTNLTKRLWAIVRSENFKAWFGDWENDPKNASKVLDENGEPRLCHHRSEADFTEFDKKLIGTSSDSGFYGHGFSFTDEGIGWYGNIDYVCFLDIKNPLYVTDDAQKFVIDYNLQDVKTKQGTLGDWAKQTLSEEFGSWEQFPMDSRQKNRLWRKLGYDGVIVQRPSTALGGKEYFVMEPGQIKSEDNNGSFNRNKKDIRYKLVDDDLFNRLQETPPLPEKPWLKYIKEQKETGKLDYEGYTKSIHENSEAYDQELASWTESAPDMIPLKADFGTALISKDPSQEDPKRPWRVTWFTTKLEPAGHKLYASKLEAVKDTVSDYREFDPKARFKQGPLYHGSGAFFDRFDLTYMGTGEGVQAFGWGIYVTERRGVAKDYAERLGTRPSTDKYGQEIAQASINGKNVSPFDLWKYAISKSPELQKWSRYVGIATLPITEMLHNILLNPKDIKSIKSDLQHAMNYRWSNTGYSEYVNILYPLMMQLIDNGILTFDKAMPSRNLYTVSVWENHTEDVLEWYGKITDEQMRKINAALLAKKGKQGDLAKLEKIDGKIYAIDKRGVRVPVPTGQELYATISAATTRTAQRTSEFLLRAGIDGIKYPVSALNGGTGDKGWNYVVFDDSQIKIEEHERFKMIPEEMLRRMEEAMKLADSSRPDEVIDQTVTSTSEQKGLDQQQVKDKIGRAIRAAYREGNERVQNVLAASTIAGIDRYIETNKPETRDRDDLTYHLEEAEEDAYQKDLGLSAAEAMNLGKDRFNFYLGGLKVFAMGNAIMEDLMKARQESARLREQGITDEALEEKIALLTGMAINSKLTYDNIKGNAGRILRHAREEKSRALQQYTKLMETMQKDEAELYDQIAELQAEIEAQEALMAELETAITELESMQTDLIESSEDLIQKVDRVISGNPRFKQVDRMQQIEQLKQRQAELKRRGELAKARMEQMIAQAKATKDQMDKIGEVIDGKKPGKPPRITDLPPIKPTFYDYMKSAMYQGMLSSPMTHFRNMVGNLTSLFSELAVDIANDPQGGMIALAQTIVAIPESIQAGIATFKDSKEYLKKYDLTKNTTKLMKYFTIITRLLAAEDAYGYNLAFTAQLASIAVMESRKPENVKAGVTYKSLIKNPTKEMLKQAQYEARRATFNYNPEGIIGIVISQIDEGIKQAEKTGALGKAAAMGFKYNVMPFTRVVANVMSWGLEWTPLGYLMSFKYGSDSIEKQRQVWMDGKNPMASPYRQRDITRSLTRATLGTVIMVMAQVLFSEIISGGGPPDWEKRRQLMETGWRPYSIKIGDRWIPYNDYWLGTALAVIGNFNDRRRYSKHYNEATGWDKLSYALMGIANTFLNKSFLSGMQNTMEAIADQRGSFISSQTAGFVGTMMPMANAIRMIGDIFYKDVHKPETMSQYLIVATRPLSLPLMDSVPKNIDVLGRPVKRQPFWHQIIGSPDTHDQPLQVIAGDGIPIDIRRTINILADAQVRIPGAASFDIKIEEGRFTLKGHDRQTYREIRGEEVTLFIIDNIERIDEAQHDREELQAIVSGLGSKATRQAKKRMEELFYEGRLRHKYDITGE